ncbi:O-antigen translocase [Flavobacterium sp.]|uniref:O-antigen translocase n=1 Tax=Flavobacterium sp. TaxID=239 RepID=UPI002A83F988|nr:O-antigen translocase [Flavobacterium sp.]
MSWIKSIAKSPLFKIASFNSASLLVRIFTGLLSSKAIAYFIGPSGMALMGNFRNFSSTLEAVGILGFQNGIVKTVAENQADKEKVYSLLTTVFYTLLITSLLLIFTVLIGSTYFLKSILNGNETYLLALQILAFTIPFTILHLFFVSVINGLSAYKKVINITIFSYIAGLIISIFLMWKFTVLGAMISVSIVSFLLFCFSGFYFLKQFSLKEVLNLQYFDFQQIKRVVVFASMTLFSSILTPIVYIYIRKLIIASQSIEAAGYYEAMSRISSFYMMFITTLVSLYYLPELSKTSSLSENKPLIRQFYKTILPVFGFGLVLMYFLKDIVILILFTKDFSAVSNLFFWQLLGDFFRAAALILAIQFFAKKLVKPYFITEIISFSILIFSSYFGIQYFGAEGAVMAYAVTYFLYFVVVGFYFRKMIF